MSSTEILIDPTDAAILTRHAWSISEHGDGLLYVIAYSENRKIYLHREIMQPEERDEVDHRNGNGLDNRRANLRVVAHRLNLANQRTQQRPKSSRYKGVSFYKRDGRWESSIKINGRKIRLGLFAAERDAAAAYNVAALAAWGDHARLNELEVA